MEIYADYYDMHDHFIGRCVMFHNPKEKEAKRIAFIEKLTGTFYILLRRENSLVPYHAKRYVTSKRWKDVYWD